MSYITERSKGELLESLPIVGEGDSAANKQQRMAIVVKCTEDLEKAIEQWANASNKLGTQVFYLNIVLGIITVLGILITFWSIFAN